MANILIVDDSMVMRKNLKTVLKQGGHNIVGEANNGRQAVEKYIELQPDIVTMDISMPLMNGVEAVERIIKQYPEAQIIMVSAVNQRKMVFDAITKGAKHYIVKPINSNELLSIVDEVSKEISGNDEPNNSGNQEVEQGFKIDNVEGRFYIRFNKCICVKDHNLLSMAVNGIMFIKPLRVTFDFEELEDIPDAVLEPIMKLGEEIKAVEGVLDYKATSEKIKEKIETWE